MKTISNKAYLKLKSFNYNNDNCNMLNSTKSIAYLRQFSIQKQNKITL